MFSCFFMYLVIFVGKFILLGPGSFCVFMNIFLYSLEHMLINFREGGREGEREGEKH